MREQSLENSSFENEYNMCTRWGVVNRICESKYHITEYDFFCILFL